MKEPAENNYVSQIFKTNGGETKSNAIETPSISLPKGGGAMKGIDEKFSVNLVNGTSSFSIPLPFSAARGASPSLGLSYNSGAGNGIFGLGWNISLASVQRKTDQALPQYQDDVESDTFLFSDAEDLVPEFKKNEDGSFALTPEAEYILNEKFSDDGLFIIRNYIPRVEGLFARIERWTEKTTGRIKWRIITKENTTTLFGWTDDAIIANPDDPSQIYEWLPEFIFDDKGNCTQYIYKKEDKTGFDKGLLHNRNRYKNGNITYTNLYIYKVLYGNKKPYKKLGDLFPDESDYMFQTVFDYGTLADTDPLETLPVWDFRPDAFSDYRPGFEIRTTRLCKRVLLFHVFDELAVLPDQSDKKTLIKSINFNYELNIEQDFTFLKTITSYGYIKKPDGSYSSKRIPPIEFEYQKHDWNIEVKTISEDALENVPVGLDEIQYHFTDLFNEGLMGILTEQANAWYYKHNLGDGKFEPVKLVATKPSFAGMGEQVQLADLDADGGKQLVSYDAAHHGYFELDDSNEWQGIQFFKSYPNINFNDPNIRMLDLNGDGKPEAVIADEQVFTWYPSMGRQGYAAAQVSTKPMDDEAGPNIVFSDSIQTIYLADMSGDGLTDIVRIKNGEVSYWPNKGYGKFGAKIALDHAPIFDHPDAFNPAYLRLADIDGSGTTDIIYLGENKFTCWKNLSGNRLSTTPFEMDFFPEVHSRSSVTITDLLGNGVPCIVWSSSLSKDARMPLKYIDLMNSKKPHIMVGYKNNLGKEVKLEYCPSTKFYVEDKLAGKPWITKLHFPVHCVVKTTVEDKISGHQFTSAYKYHHGYYDHAEREFRGFGMVEQTDAETFEHWVKTGASNITEAPLHQEPVVSKSWYHTGAYLQTGTIVQQFAGDYWYAEMERQGFLVTHPEVALADARLVAAPGIGTDLLDHLSAGEWQEALRACKGMGLRSEIFARDAAKFGNTHQALIRELTPFSVSDRNCVIELLQPRGKNKHAVFIVKESESITYNYERNPDDPRISHQLNIKFDEYGHILESASVVYPRVNGDGSLPAETQQEQGKTVILYNYHQFTNDVVSNDAYRLRLPAEIKTYELKGVPKSATYYSTDDFADILSDAKSTTVLYHEINKVIAGQAQKRLIEHQRVIYYANDLENALASHQLESMAIPYESYQLAYTRELLHDIYSEKKTDNELVDLMKEAKFLGTHADTQWWIPSGRSNFIDPANPLADSIAKAAERFYFPVSFTGPYGETTVVQYEKYLLFMNQLTDVFGNQTKVEIFNFRTLLPARIKDINGNFSESIYDELGLVKAVAVLGKGAEADELTGITEITDAAESAAILDFFQAPDSVELLSRGKTLLNRATSRFMYDFEAYMVSGKPAVTAGIVRENHFKQMADSPVQIAFEYSNGLGEVVMKKVQAEPGPAKKVTVPTPGSIVVNTINTATLVPKQLRWIGNGRTIKNNAGNVVKQYEPYFSVTWQYEDYKELVETGVTPIMYYDAMGRLIKTQMPDGTFSKLEFDAWKQKVYDANDTILETSWYTNRTNRAIDAILLAEGKDPGREKQAADKAAKHANTPGILHMDTLGRIVLSIDHNKNITTEVDEFYFTRVEQDAEGNLRSVIDARQNTVMQYKYDMLGNLVYQHSMDAGKRWLLANIMGQPFRTWDERNHEFQYFYDAGHRPTQSKVLAGDGAIPLNHIFDRVFYGESLLTGNRTDVNRQNEATLQTSNILGQVIKHYDTGGLLDTPEYNFKGQALVTTRKLFANYKEIANWIDANLVNDLEPGPGFAITTTTDALGRIILQKTPDQSMITPIYNEAGLLESETVLLPGAAHPTVYIKDIDYNEKGQREKIIYGNEVTTRFYYDKETFRLKRLESKKQNGDVLQNLLYTFDAVGNITHVEDKAIPINFFANTIIEPVSEFTYDALYRLTEATGRENTAAINFGTCDNWNDQPFMLAMGSGNPMTVRNYTQRYQYDAVGNITEMKHLALGGNWTRGYAYETTKNWLKSTTIGDNGNPASYNKYQHHPKHGYLETLPHLDKITWNFKEEVVMSTRQHCTGDNIPVITYYQYSGNGQRIRKITENQAGGGGTPSKKDERIYIAGYELYIQHTGANAGLKRESLSLHDQGTRFVMIETRNEVDDGTEKQLVRYQLYNHLGSSAMEVEGGVDARIIFYEEYHPFGTTSYQAKNSDIRSAAKRYRFTGMERDEETGLEYHSARYYMPWLGRWLNADPIGIGDGVNLYRYSKNSPVVLSDPSGLDTRLSVDQGTHTITYSTTNHYYGTAAEIAQLTPIARQAEAFYNAPPIETESETTARLAGTPAGPPRASTYTDASGQIWTVRYNVNYVFHDTATDPLPADLQTIYSNFRSGAGTTIADFQRLLRSGTAGVTGYQPGDNIFVMGPVGTSVGGITYLVSDPNVATAPTFGGPLSRALVTLGNRPGYTLESLIHETGHTLGFDERYEDFGPLSTNHSGFAYDLMRGATGRSLPNIAMHPTHITSAAEFALTVANGNTITDRVITGIQVDDTGTGGNIEQFQAGGTVNPAYTARQQALQTEIWRPQRVFTLQQLLPTPAMLNQMYPPPPPGTLPPNLWTHPPALPQRSPALPVINPLVVPF